MKTMQWLIRREMWEHKGMLLRAPLILGAVLLSVSVLSMVTMITRGIFQFDVDDHGMHLNAETFAMTVAGHKRMMVAKAIEHYMGASAPLFMMLAVVVFFYCLGALYDERRDRSLLFWKSLPVSDTATVLSKVALALIVAPLITLAIGSAVSLLLIVIVCIALAANHLDLFGIVFTTPDLYLAPLKLLALLPVYALWALPTVGWLLMVSAWARSKVFLWAVGMPLLLGVLLVWGNHLFNFDVNAQWFFEHIVGRLLLGVAPGCWLLFEREGTRVEVTDHGPRFEFSDTFSQSWATLATPSVWIGVAAGVAMIAVAIWLRRRRDDA